MKNKKKKDRIKRPNLLLYWIYMPIGKLIARFVFRMRVAYRDEKLKKLKPPFIALGTHSCVMDVGLIITALAPHRLNVVCGRDVFTWKPIKPLKNLLGLLQISQFATDIGNIRKMKKAIDSGCSLAFFPEGKISLDGRPMHYISQSLAKLLKLLNVPVVMCHNNGGYSSRPKWFHGIKRGRIEQTVKLLFTVEQLNTLSVKEIHGMLKEAFDYNDHIFQTSNNIRYESKTPAKGLHYILYKCPKCGAEYENESTDREIICNACGNRVEYTEYGQLIPKTPDSVAFERVDLWYDYEKESVREEIAAEDYLISHPVVWEKNIDDVYVETGEGSLYINGAYIGFNGTDLEGNPVELKCPLKTLYTIVQKNKEAIDLTIDGVVHRFYFREGKYSAKYTIIVEETFKILNSKH